MTKEIECIIRELKCNKNLTSEQIQNYKKRLRGLQRNNIFDNLRNDSLKLDKLLFDDRSTFWKKIAAFRKKQSRRSVISSETPSTQDFTKYYSDLFSQKDRKSNSEHIQIEKIVEEKLESLKGHLLACKFDRNFIAKNISSLKFNKSPGFDQISNEFCLKS